MSKYQIAEYLVYLKVSNRKKLLVEGRDDHDFFCVVFEVLFGTNWRDELNIDIDVSEKLLSDGPNNILGNRQKVETVCESVVNKEFASRIMGFVDREVREFYLADRITDALCRHNIIDRLVWSRGHSIENYIFNPEIMRNTILSLCDQNVYHQAFQLFLTCFDAILREAAVISLMAINLENFEKIRTSIDDSMFTLAENNLSINIENWVQRLILKFPQTNREDHIERYYRSRQIIDNTESQVVRWYVHGHIGVRVIWATFMICVNRFNGNMNSYSMSEIQRLRSCATTFAERIRQNNIEYPNHIIDFASPIK